jgi:hypothetical protein
LLLLAQRIPCISKQKKNHDFTQDSCRGSGVVCDGGNTQAAIQEPGLFAFYHPNADVLNGGAPTPEAALASAPPAASEAYAAMESGIAPSGAQRYRSYVASGTFPGHGARRHRGG